MRRPVSEKSSPTVLSRARSRWRTWLVACTLAAVAWPSTGPLPWLVLEFGEHVTAAATLDHDRDGHAADAAHDAADVPGSPTHPLDHNCAQCEVLKHLARCVLPGAAETLVRLSPGEPVLAFVATEPLHAGFSATRPPIRGPPKSFA
jgi:hypothetical protein